MDYHDAKETARKKMAARKDAILSLTTPLAQSPGFRAAIFFLAVFFRITHDELSEGTTHSLESIRQDTLFNPELTLS